MKPHQIASILYQVADAIENSKRPDKNLVIKDLRRLLAAFQQKAAGKMTVGELITKLQESDPNLPVSLSISDPDDIAYTNEITSVENGKIEGWVSSDNTAAFAPWAEGGRYIVK